MNILQIIGVAFVSTALTILIKQYKPEIAFAVPIVCTVVIIFYIYPYISELLNVFEEIAGRTGIKEAYVKIIIKIIGIAYICRFSAELCKDAGETSVAAKIEFAGKIMIIMFSLPMIYDLLDLLKTITDI